MVQAERQTQFACRSRLDIIANILKEAEPGVRKTRIMYLCNLNFRQLGAYLDFLLTKNLLALHTSSGVHTYRTTKKGLSLLEAYKNLQAVISS